MIYITGDTHIPIDIHKLATRYFTQQTEMTKTDYLIICGDFGGVWNNSNEEKYWIKWLNQKNFTTLFVDGNHENYNLLNAYDVEQFHGGKVHKVADSIYHLMRGQVFEIDGNTIFTMGGATSHDKAYRKENVSWWADELPNDAEYNEAEKNLDKVNRKVDYIITHCAPDSVQQLFAYWYEKDKLTNFLESVSWSVNYKRWYFGHYHINKNIDDKHIVLYDAIVRME